MNPITGAHRHVTQLRADLLGAYREAVARGACPGELASLLTGLAGCEFVMSVTDPGRAGAHDATGILLKEISTTARGGERPYPLVFTVADSPGRVDQLLENLAGAFHDGSDAAIAKCLFDLASACAPVALTPLIEAHAPGELATLSGVQLAAPDIPGPTPPDIATTNSYLRR